MYIFIYEYIYRPDMLRTSPHSDLILPSMYDTYIEHEGEEIPYKCTIQLKQKLCNYPYVSICL